MYKDNDLMNRVYRFLEADDQVPPTSSINPNNQNPQSAQTQNQNPSAQENQSAQEGQTQTQAPTQIYYFTGALASGNTKVQQSLLQNQNFKDAIDNFLKGKTQSNEIKVKEESFLPIINEEGNSSYVLAITTINLDQTEAHHFITLSSNEFNSLDELGNKIASAKSPEESPLILTSQNSSDPQEKERYSIISNKIAKGFSNENQEGEEGDQNNPSETTGSNPNVFTGEERRAVSEVVVKNINKMFKDVLEDPSNREKFKNEVEKALSERKLFTDEIEITPSTKDNIKYEVKPYETLVESYKSSLKRFKEKNDPDPLSDIIEFPISFTCPSLINIKKKDLSEEEKSTLEAEKAEEGLKPCTVKDIQEVSQEIFKGMLEGIKDKVIDIKEFNIKTKSSNAFSSSKDITLITNVIIETPNKNKEVKVRVNEKGEMNATFHVIFRKGVTKKAGQGILSAVGKAASATLSSLAKNTNAGKGVSGTHSL